MFCFKHKKYLGVLQDQVQPRRIYIKYNQGGYRSSTTKGDVDQVQPRRIWIKYNQGGYISSTTKADVDQVQPRRI